MLTVPRRFLAVSLALAVPIGALCAPLVHAHPDDHHGGHHAASRVHAHLGGHNLDNHERDHHDGDLDHHGDDLDHHGDDHDGPSNSAAVEPEGEPEQVSRVSFFVAVQVDDLIPAGLQPLGFTLPVPLESVMRQPPAVSHAHDPPVVARSSPRAPPTYLS